MLKRLLCVIALLCPLSFAQFWGTANQAPPGGVIVNGGGDGSTACNSGECLQKMLLISSPSLATFLGNRANMVSYPGNWSIFNQPAVSTQATISKAAVASTRHVATCISFTATATTAVAAAANVQVNLRDGATGAGTVLWTQQIFIAANTGQLAGPVNFCGLNVVGSINTAMTLEFSGLITNLFESVTLEGYDVN